MQLSENLGKRLKMIRLYSGIKQKELAGELGIQSSQLSMYEQGKREPSLSFLETYCNFFSMPLSQLFTFHQIDHDLESEADIINDLGRLLSDLEKIKLQNKNEQKS